MESGKIAKAPSGGFSDPSEATGFRGVQEMENGLMNRMLLMAICEYLPSAMIGAIFIYFSGTGAHEFG